MPVARTCAHCKKTFLCSTYQLIDHVFNKCPEYKKFEEKQKKLTQSSKPNSSLRFVPTFSKRFLSSKNTSSSP